MPRFQQHPKLLLGLKVPEETKESRVPLDKKAHLALLEEQERKVTKEPLEILVKKVNEVAVDVLGLLEDYLT